MFGMNENVTHKKVLNYVNVTSQKYGEIFI
jgi:hypothetical protein